jgi:hypothetical protein
VVIPSDDLFEKNVSTIQEIRARRGPVLALSNTSTLPVAVDDVIVVPQLHELLDPLLMLVSAAVPRVSDRDGARLRHRPAAQSSEERDGGVTHRAVSWNVAQFLLAAVRAR